jgi:apolipoprotein N-acyltransferase
MAADNFTGTPAPVTGAEFRPTTFMRLLLALVAGAIGPLSFSPFNMWLLGFVSVLGFYLSLKNASPETGALVGWCYGLGLFGVGASWIYVSISVYGNTGAFLAGLITALFVAAMALFFALQGWLNQRFFNRSFYVSSFAALWVLLEWLRGWFFTGFPWLYAGAAHVNSPFAGVAPLFGVLGISLVIVLSGAGFGEMFLAYHRRHSPYDVARTYVPTALFLLWICASLTDGLDWVEPVDGETITIGLVQGNIDLRLKFDRNFTEQNLKLYDELTASLWDADIVVWPETAIPYVYDDANPVVTYLTAEASSNNATLVTGIFGRTGNGLHNSITSLGNGTGIYHKQKLVPFGEYVPLRGLMSSVLQIFELPMSSLEKGPSGQSLLTAGQYVLAPFICYEVVYPDFVRRQARTADILVTISNDTWFGASWGPLQHLQIAAMRALENGRYMVRATNNGVSAIIDEKGNILSRSEQFQVEVLRGDVQVFTGRTPFSWWGSWPVLLLCLGLLTLCYKVDAQWLKDRLNLKKSSYIQ